MNEHQPHHDSNPDDSPDAHERSRAREPRVWIGSLADYNNGTLHGEWVDAAVEDEELVAAARRIVTSSETPDAEEWAIFDSDDFGDFKVGEYEYLSTVAQVARGIQEHGDAFAYWADLHSGDAEMLAQFQDAYLGAYDSSADWAREVLAETDLEQQIEQHLGDELARYVHVDYDGWARDAWLSGDVHVAHRDSGGVWIFHANT